jgi:DNA-binding transcriptional LysR family regulator
VAAAALAAKGVKLTPALELSSAESLKRAVLSGGFTLLSQHAVRRTRPALRGPVRAFWNWLERTIAPSA